MRVQLSNEESSHGCLWFLLLGWLYLLVVLIRWYIGFMVLVCIDWWMALLKKTEDKGYVWKCKRWFTGRKKTYYCHDCSHNFRG